MIKLLQQLDDQTDITPHTWRLNISPDESGELLYGEVPIAVFHELSELEEYVEALSGHNETLTLSRVCEILEDGA